MSPQSCKTVKWLLLVSAVAFLSACSSHPRTGLSTAKITPATPSTVATAKTALNPGVVALNVARQMVGIPYRYGGTDPSGFDCSGLVQYSFKQAGIHLPRTSRDIFRNSQLIKPGNQQPGDLVFFAISPGKISHVGIYSGNNSFIHSPSSGKGVSYASLATPYWQKRLVGVGRI